MDYTILRAKLSAMLRRDAHADKNGEYRVRSLYFDTPTDRALREKIEGMDRREKFRVRRYLGNDDYLVLEKKSKRRGLSYKQSVEITADELCALQSGDTGWMARDQRELVAELYCKMTSDLLRPKTIVDYVREPFVCDAGNVRITLDRNIRTGLFSTDFFDDALPTIAPEHELVLLEVKYGAFIPDYIVSLLQLESRRAAACSKYALCRIYG
jgi:hypothetical protein